MVAECTSASEAVKGVLYLHKLMAEMRHEKLAKVTLFKDNSVAEAWIQNETDHQMSHNIETWYQHIQDHVEEISG